MGLLDLLPEQMKQVGGDANAATKWDVRARTIVRFKTQLVDHALLDDMDLRRMKKNASSVEADDLVLKDSPPWPVLVWMARDFAAHQGLLDEARNFARIPEVKKR
jgi:hypothetical protein